MAPKLSDTLTVYDPTTGNLLARVALNGYDIDAGGLFPNSGAMRSFVLLDGDLWEQWNAVSVVNLTHETGQNVPVRIAALPVEADSYGLLEFL